MPSTPGEIPNRATTRWMLIALPVVVVAPLIPSAFYSDERFKVYMHAALYEGSLVRILHDVFGEFDSYLNFGNFRPLARIVERFEHSVAFETSMATGFPPHIAHGVFRAMV